MSITTAPMLNQPAPAVLPLIPLPPTEPDGENQVRGSGEPSALVLPTSIFLVAPGAESVPVRSAVAVRPHLE